MNHPTTLFLLPDVALQQSIMRPTVGKRGLRNEADLMGSLLQFLRLIHFDRCVGCKFIGF